MASPPYLLVVDDDPDTRGLFAEMLRIEGYHVEVASGGEEAIRRLCDPGATPDLILLDLAMPGMDGYQFHRVQQQYLRWARIPVVIVSAFASPEQADTLGVAAVLLKPVALADLLAAVEAHRLHPEPGKG